VTVGHLVDGRYVVSAPHGVRDPGRLLADLSGAGSVLAGFDFPIGVPRAWARAVGVTRFRALLPVLGTGEWRRFFEPAVRPGDIDLHRPFYPARPGGTSQAHLVDGLGVGSMDDLLRRCDRRTETRRAACSIFWTLGASQVGRAAIAGWREVLQPAGDEVSLWPFDGPLDALLAQRDLVVAETYPAEVSAQLALSGAKSDPGARAANAPAIHREAERLGIELTNDLVVMLERGFDSDDDFDAVIGLLGMLAVVLGDRSSGEPRDDDGLQVEGWILGQAAASATAVRPRAGPVAATARERPDLWARADDLDADVWPEYNRHGNVVNRYWGRLDTEFPECQFVLRDEGGDELLAQGHTIPFRWDGTVPGLPAGIDGLLEDAFALREQSGTPNALAALAVEIPPAHRSRGLSRTMLEAMTTLAARDRLADLLAPVRPSWKERYPLVPIERYAAWTNPDGLPFDPWLRVHARMGAEILQTEPQSLLICAGVASWEEWTGLRFPESGDYVFPHGLATVRIDVEADVGTYWEPNVWVRHRVPQKPV